MPELLCLAKIGIFHFVIGIRLAWYMDSIIHQEGYIIFPSDFSFSGFIYPSVRGFRPYRIRNWLQVDFVLIKTIPCGKRWLWLIRKANSGFFVNQIRSLKSGGVEKRVKWLFFRIYINLKFVVRIKSSIT